MSGVDIFQERLRKKEVKNTTPVSRRESNFDNPNSFLERQKMEELRRASEKLEGLRNLKIDSRVFF